MAHRVASPGEAVCVEIRFLRASTRWYSDALNPAVHTLKRIPVAEGRWTP
jgi:hypothetical protein